MKFCVYGCMHVCVFVDVYIYVCMCIFVSICGYTYTHISTTTEWCYNGRKYLKRQQSFLPGSITLRTSCYQFPGTPHEGVRMSQHNCGVTVGNISI